MQATHGKGHDAAAGLLSLATAAAGNEPLPPTTPPPPPPAEGSLMQSLMAAAMSVNVPVPRSSHVDPDVPADSPPLATRKPRVRKRVSDDAGGLAESAGPTVKKPKARGMGARHDLGITLGQAIQIDMDKPLNELMRLWIDSRGFAPAGGVAPALWSIEQLADAIRRRIQHDNPEYLSTALKSSLLPVIDLLGQLRGEAHARAVEALCLGLSNRRSAIEAFGRTLVLRAGRLGDLLAPTLRITARFTSKRMLLNQAQPGPEDDKGRASGAAGRKGGRAQQPLSHMLLGEAVRAEPKLARTIWHALFDGLRDAAGPGEEAGAQDDIVQLVQMAITRGGSDWDGLPVLLEALAQACGGRDMPERLLARTAALLLRSSSDSGGAASTMTALCGVLSARGWNPAHQKVLRELWQSASDTNILREQARALEPLMHDTDEAPLALATLVREALAASNGMAADRFVGRITGPLQGFLERQSLTEDRQLALIDILCANLAPGLDTLSPEQRRLVLQRLAGGLAHYANQRLVERFFHGLLTQGVATPWLAHAISGHRHCCDALERSAIGQVPPLSCGRSQAIARVIAASVPVSPPGTVINRTQRHVLVEKLALCTPALPPDHWVAWISGFMEALVNRTDLNVRLAVLLNGLVIETPRMGAPETEAFGWALGQGLGGLTITEGAAACLLKELPFVLPRLSAAAARAFLDGLEAGLGGHGMRAALRSGMDAVTTSTPIDRPSTSTTPPTVASPPTPEPSERDRRAKESTRQIHTAVHGLLGRVTSDQVPFAADPALQAAFQAAMQLEPDPTRAVKMLCKAIQIAIAQATDARPGSADLPAPAWKVAPGVARQVTLMAIARTARAVVEASALAVLADDVTRWLAGTPTGPQSSVNPHHLAYAWACGLQVADNPQALRAMVKAIATYRAPLVTSPPSHDRELANGLRQALAAQNGGPARLTEALGMLLDLPTFSAGMPPAQLAAIAAQNREVVLGLIGGIDGIPQALAAASRMSLQRSVRLLSRLASTVTGRGLGAGQDPVHACEKAVLDTLLAEPRPGDARPALTDPQALRMTMALALAIDLALEGERRRQPPAMRGLIACFDPPALPVAAASQLSAKRRALCWQAVWMARHPERLLSSDALSTPEAVNLLCELYELPKAMAPRQAGHSLAKLVRVQIPADMKLEAAVRLMRAVAPQLNPQSVASARRELIEVVRGLELDVTKAGPAERPQAQARLDRAITQVREVYEGVRRHPDIARLLAPAAVAAGTPATDLATLRMLLSRAQAETEELQRPHQPPWVAQELLPIARQVHDALQVAVEAAQAAGKADGKATPGTPGDANAKVPAPSSSSTRKDPS